MLTAELLLVRALLLALSCTTAVVLSIPVFPERVGRRQVRQGEPIGNRKSPGGRSDHAYAGGAVASGDHSSRSSCKVVLKAV